MKFSDLRILPKILSCIALLALVTLGTLAYTSQSMLKIDAAYMDIVGNEAVAVEDILEAEIQAARFSGAMLGLASAHDPAEFKALTEELKKEAATFHAKIEDAGKHEPNMAPRFAELVAKFDEAQSHVTELEGAALVGNAAFTAKIAGEMKEKVEHVVEGLEEISAEFRKDMADRVIEEQTATNSTILFSFIAVIIALVLITGLAVMIAKNGVTAPILKIVQAMTRLANKEHVSEIPGTERKDEVGEMARSLEVLRQAEQEAIGRERAMVSQSIGRALQKLAAKDLTFRLEDNLPEAYEELRRNFNESMATLEQVMQLVSASSTNINGNTQEISTASNDLARRTESQAAGLEETSAAVAEITRKVNETAQGAKQARDTVQNAKTEATQVGDVVKQAIAKMNVIEESSRKIESITSVINEIAFQTNLLALNAGVEAARAGDTGKGFAVVASEVRALAQRSGDAAKEIGGLIASSSQQIGEGVQLVSTAGTSIDGIMKRVAEINDLVAAIAARADEQATGLQQINVAVGQMDQSTQQNAAMVEEATAATANLAAQSTELNGMIGEFVTRRAA